MKELVLNVKGMMCEGCENRIKNVVKSIEGVDDVQAEYNTGKVTVTVDKDIAEQAILEAIDDIGYEVVKED